MKGDYFRRIAVVLVAVGLYYSNYEKSPTLQYALAALCFAIVVQGLIALKSSKDTDPLSILGSLLMGISILIRIK
ncbi:MAG: hypothetical protein ACXVOI_11280 [Tumebacillaceae bacterium]